MKNTRCNKTISEILGEVILSLIAVTSVFIMYLRVVSSPGPIHILYVIINGKREAGRVEAC